MENTSVPTLHYWKIRGLGSYMTMALEAAGVKYNMTQYTDPADWFGRDKP